MTEAIDMKYSSLKITDTSQWILSVAGCLLLLFAFAVSAAAQPNEYSSVVRYDGYGRVIATVAPDPDGGGSLGHPATRTAYDALGLAVKTETGELADWQSGVWPQNWQGFTVFTTTHHSYDTMNRRVKTRVVGSDGQTVSLTQFNTDRQGRPACTAVRMNPAAYASAPPNACDATPNPPPGKEDRISRNIYDAAGQLVQVRKGLGTSLNQAEATYSYTANGKQYEVIDANGNRARMTYDQHDRQIGWYFPSKTRPTAYNDATPATARSSAGGASTTDYEAYSYDANGNRKTLRKRDGRTITYNYDALNRVVSKTDPDPATRHVYYGYDNRDLQVYARFDSASGPGIDIVYDGFGRIKETTNKMFATHRKLSYQYDKNGNRTRITHPDNKYFTYDYDRLDRITQIKENGSAVLTTNAYNDRGLPATMTRTGATTNYSYDAASRPSGSVHNLAGTYGDVTYGFGYNPASQIISKSISNKAYITNSHYNIDRQYTTNGLNQYTATNTGASFTYDANGNLTGDGTTTYAYDIENRLVTARGKKEANLIYDPMGRLFETNANGSLAQTTTQFLYDGDALVAEYSNAGALLHRYVHAGGVDSPVVWYIGATVGSGSRSHLHANWQGSITAVTDANASVQWINGYDAYGIPNWFNEGRFQYTGQIMIPELEMYHYKARVYSPTMGRFLQTDPIGYEDQVNLYAYVGNDPIGKIDPTGREGVLTLKILKGSNFDSHAWIEYEKTGGTGPKSYGTFAKDQKGKEGLRVNQELNNRSQYEGYAIKNDRFAFRQWRLNDEQEKKLNAVIADYKAQGSGAWSLLSNCTCFAYEAVEQATGENLEPWGIDTPKKLYNVVTEANGNKVGRGVVGGRNPYHGLVKNEPQFFDPNYVSRNWPK